MSRVPHLSRRTFLASAAAVGGALALGFDIPLAPRAVRASESRAEITVWIVLGARWEERDLTVQYGALYERYQKAVPMLIPWKPPAAPHAH